ncbi:adenosine deaminase, tRNA-specific 3 [Mortierella sp. GBA30]|nr:adenosine deaminase, tRNA-specific 3 [Mortierella sp. GBA30]
MLNQVLPDAEVRPLETENVYISTIEPKQTNQVLKFIRSQLPPTKGLDHIKQIRKTTRDDGESALSLHDLTQLLEKAGLEAIVTPRIHGVPVYPPLTRHQFEIWKLAWPTTFREDTNRHPEMSETELGTILGHMQSTWKLAANATCKGEEILATAHDTRNSTKHILNHAVMNCIEAVAKREREGCRTHSPHHHHQHFHDLLEEQENKGTASSLSSPAAEDTTQQQPHSPHCGEKRKENPEGDIKTVVSHKKSHLETNTTHDGKEKYKDEIEEDNEEKEKDDSSRTPTGKKAYLCTGYDVYLTHEPCVMCSMALVHSRVGRVFYTLPIPASGGLGSVHKIHSHPNLNHHFFVYQHVGHEEMDHGGENWAGETSVTAIEEAKALQKKTMDC